MSNTFKCCMKCYKDVLTKNNLAAEIWIDLCKVVMCKPDPCTGLNFSILMDPEEQTPEVVVAFEDLEEIGALVSTEADERFLCIKVVSVQDRADAICFQPCHVMLRQKKGA